MTLTAADVRSTAFPASSRLRRGYDADAVDAFVERIAVRLETGEGLSSNDVYHVPFGRAGLGGRGYRSTEVDAFLERVHVELARLEDGWGHENVPAQAPEGATGAGDDEGAAADDGEAADAADRADASVDDGMAAVDPAELPADGEALAEVAASDADDPADPR